MGLLKILGYAIRCLAAAWLEAARNTARASYRVHVDIDAPAGLVWQLVTARSIEFEGLLPHRIESVPRRDGSRLVDCRVTVDGNVSPFTYRVLDERPGEALLIEVVNDLTDPAFVQGEEHYVATTLAEGPGGTTRLGVVTEITPASPAGRFWVPMSALINALKIKRRAEAMLAPEPAAATSGRFSAAMATGLITFASFMHMFGWHYAAMAILVILVHEIGHVVAMRWMGVRVYGIYFVPFFGGVAVGEGERTQGERGLVALMGPGFSLVTTALFFMAWRLSGDGTLRDLAMTSAFLNAVNLLPLMPLDGGHVVASLLSRMDAARSQLAHIGLLAAGIAAACWLSWQALALLLLVHGVMALGTSGEADGSSAPAEIEADEYRLLLVAYIATLAFYGSILLAL